MRKLKQLNLRWAISGLLLIFVLAVFGFYGFTKVQTSRAVKELKTKESILLTKEKEYKELASDPWYMKYTAANTLEQESKTIAWKETITYLIDIFNQVSSLDDNRSNVALEDFQVNIDYTVNLRGTIGTIRDMYLPGWLLDKFIALETIDFIHIPFYKKNGDVFEFILKATIKTYDRFQWSL